METKSEFVFGSNLSGNNMIGSIPSALLDKTRNKALVLRYAHIFLLIVNFDSAYNFEGTKL